MLAGKARRKWQIVPIFKQGGSGTEPEPETGTVGTVFQEPKAEPEPPEPFPGTETGTVLSWLTAENAEKPFLQRGTARTENRNRSNRSTPKP